MSDVSTKVLEKLDAALDVGGEYDPESERYDHHQKGFTEVFGHGFNTKLSSAGLIYKVRREDAFLRFLVGLVERICADDDDSAFY